MGGNMAWGGTEIPDEIKAYHTFVTGIGTAPNTIVDVNFHGVLNTQHVDPLDPYAVNDPGYGSNEKNPYIWGYHQLSDPNPDVDEAQDQWDTHNDDIVAIDPPSSWVDFFDVAEGKIGIDDEEDEEDALVEAFEAKERGSLLRAEGRMAAQLADQNAAAGSALFLGFGLLEAAHRAEVARFRAELRTDKRRLNKQLMVQAVGQMGELLKFKVEEGRMATAQRMDLARFNITANQDYTLNMVKLHESAKLWNMNLLARGTGMNQISGSPVLQKDQPWQLTVASLALQGLGSVSGLVGGLLPALI